MRPTLTVNTISLKSRKVGLLGTSALVCLALSTPVMATDFFTTNSIGSTNGVGTTTGATVAAIAANVINGSDTVNLGIVLKTTGNNLEGIKTGGNANKVIISKTGSIETEGNFSSGIYNNRSSNTTTVFGSVKTTGAKSAALLFHDEMR